MQGATRCRCSPLRNPASPRRTVSFDAAAEAHLRLAASGLERACNAEIPVVLAGKPESIRFRSKHKNDLLSAFEALAERQHRSA